MSSSSNPQASVPNPVAQVAPPSERHTHGLVGQDLLPEDAEKQFDEIEMIGEEEASGLAAATDVSAGMRYLHCSRTIHQLVTDRNRAVGLYIAVASLLWTASSWILNAKPSGKLFVPIDVIQRWCLPATFGTLAGLALFVALLLVRTRVGLIYEVAKMQVLLGLPVGRVQRINPLGIFFIMHALISVAGGCSAALLSFHFLYRQEADTDGPALCISILIGLALTAFLLLLYIGMVRHTTADRKLLDVQGRYRASTPAARPQAPPNG